MQSVEPGYCNAVKAVNSTCRDRDLHRYSTIHCFLWRAAGRDFDVIITARLEICLETPRNIGHSRVGVRLSQEIEHLSAQCLCIINGLPAKRDAPEEILLPLVNRNDDVNLAGLLVESITGRIDHSIQKSFRDI